jgi:cytidylate kinase
MAILTVSRQYKSGGKTLGQAVAKEMSYAYVDRKTILDDMRQAGERWEEQAKEYDENYPTVWQRYKWAFRGFVALNQYHFLEHALTDNVVIMGRGGNFLLKGIPYALRVRTTAPTEKRIERVMEEVGANREHAKWLIEKADSEMAGAVYLIYGRRWDDPAEYDMVFDTSLHPMEGILGRVKSALLERDARRTEKAKVALQLRMLAAKVKAGIATDPNLLISVLDVTPKEEGLPEYGIIVKGVVHNQDDIHRIKEAAKNIAGDLPLEFELQYRWYGRMGPHEFK